MGSIENLLVPNIYNIYAKSLTVEKDVTVGGDVTANNFIGAVTIPPGLANEFFVTNSTGTASLFAPIFNHFPSVIPASYLDSDNGIISWKLLSGLVKI